MTLFRYFIFVCNLNDVHQLLYIAECRSDLIGLVKLIDTLRKAHTLHLLKQLVHNLDKRPRTVFLEKMVRLLLHFDIQADLLHQMTLTELIPGRKGLVITLQKVQIVQPFGEAVQLLLNGLFALSYSGKIEVTIPRFELQSNLPKIIRVILQVLLYILIQMAGRGVDAVDREEFAPA